MNYPWAPHLNKIPFRTTRSFHQAFPWTGSVGGMGTASYGSIVPAFSVHTTALSDMSRPEMVVYDKFDAYIDEFKQFFKLGSRVNAVVINGQFGSGDGEIGGVIGKIYSYNIDYKNKRIRVFVISDVDNSVHEVYPETLLNKDHIRESIESRINGFSLFETYQTTTTDVFWHGSTDMDFSGKKGIHVGTKLAATQALEARIGVPATGEWDGSRQYGDALLAGKRTLNNKEKERGYYCATGFNRGKDLPEDDYYPSDREEKAVYSDGTIVPIDCRPIVFKVSIIGQMSNTTRTPHNDTKANSMMLRNLKLGNAKRGYYYINDGEDVGSISAVVPDGTFLRVL